MKYIGTYCILSTENTVFEEPEAKICEKGMHFCENPLDVLNFYPLIGDNGKPNEFAMVEALAPAKTDDNQKFCTTKLRIGAKISLVGLCSAAVDFVMSKIDKTKKQQVMDSAATNTGDCSAATNTGDCSAATNTGDWSAATNTGNRSAASVEGKESFAVATGIKGMVKGALGCFLACAEWEQNERGEWHPVAFISGKVDGKKIKDDTWYTVKDGNFVEVEK